MNILVSNDDGVYAEGIIVLVQALQQMGHSVCVVAPDRNRSGASNSLTLNDPLRLWTLDNGFMCVVGTPTDCVHLAVTGLLEQKPDMVIAGINSGANLGDDILYSGTVAAAMEGRVLGYPAMAVSLAGGNGEPRHYPTAVAVVKTLIEQIQSEPLPQKTILNINVPDVPLAELRGMHITRLGARHIAEPVVKTTDPRGRPIYWIGPAGPEQDAGPGTDFDAINRGFASITPLQLDLTDHAALPRLNQWASGCKL